MLIPILLLALLQTAQPDTTSPNTRKHTKRQAIFPGFRLDTNFRSLLEPDPSVYAVVPAWLRSKKTGQPVYIIDGKVATAAQMKSLTRSNVSSVNRIEGKTAEPMYGKVAQHGIVAITTKSALLPKTD